MTLQAFDGAEIKLLGCQEQSMVLHHDLEDRDGDVIFNVEIRNRKSETRTLDTGHDSQYDS
jgi:hypothetical protein